MGDGLCVAVSWLDDNTDDDDGAWIDALGPKVKEGSKVIGTEIEVVFVVIDDTRVTSDLLWVACAVLVTVCKSWDVVSLTSDMLGVTSDMICEANAVLETV